MTMTFEELLASLGDDPDDSETLFRELKNLPEDLAQCGGAVAFYAKSLVPRGRYVRAGERYVLAPLNFVAFTPRYRRATHVTIELRGNLREFEVLDDVPVRDARASSYSVCVLKKPSELAAVVSYIRRARELYRRGSARDRTAPVTKEVKGFD